VLVDGAGVAEDEVAVDRLGAWVGVGVVSAESPPEQPPSARATRPAAATARRAAIDPPYDRASDEDVVTVSLPGEDWLAGLIEGAEVPDGVQLVVWAIDDDPPDRAIEVVVPPYIGDRSGLSRLSRLSRLRLVQTLTAGYEDVLPHLPAGVALANAAGVHDASTAELAVGLSIAALRGLPAHVRHQSEGRWVPQFGTALADRRVLIVGYGGVGSAVHRRLQGFEVEVTPVASRPRSAPDGTAVHGVDELSTLLPDHDVVIVTVPLTDATRGLVGADFLARMPDGALLVNVARGAVVDTDALLAEVRSGRLRAAVDVVDPEPLPSGHPLWAEPGFLLTPHVGGASSAFQPRAFALLRDMVTRVGSGRPPRNLVIPGRAYG
jgi:phosphoglycerate dehydrogenase-like enzyme